MKKAVCIFLAVIVLVAAGFWILISTNPDLAAELGLASGPGKPAEIISMNDVIANAPSVTGIVKNTGEKAILIENEQGEYWVSLNVENKDSMVSFSIGDEVVFRDVDGNEFRYEAVELETLEKAAVEEMQAGDWDLSLFTCTVGGQTRVTVRCIEKTT